MKKFLTSLCLLSLCLMSNGWSFSSFGFNSLGEEQLPLDARQAAMGNSGMAMTNTGYNILNPASIDFNDQTHFTVAGSFENVNIENKNLELSGLNSSINYVNMNFPIGFLGSIGVAYWGHFAKNFSAEIEYDDGDKEEFDFDGGTYEIAPAWSFRFPGRLRKLSIGATWHFVMGHDRHSFSYYPESQGDELVDQMAAKETVIRKIDIHTSPSSENPGYFTTSAQYHSKICDFFISYSNEYSIDRDYTITNIAGSKDSLVSSFKELEQTIPAMLGTGVVFRFIPRLTLAADFFMSNWKDKDYTIMNQDGFNVSDSISADVQQRLGIGVEWSGSAKYFDPIYKKLSYRVGFTHENLYIDDVDEYAVSLGSGFPMGKRGSKIDFAIKRGVRKAAANDTQEKFWRLNFSFSGIGNWGKSSR